MTNKIEEVNVSTYKHQPFAMLAVALCGTAFSFSVFAQASAPASAGQAASAGKFVAGLQPDRRPEGAPVIAQFQVADKQLERYLTGVSKPWPGNVEQIARTGAWFVPLRYPGMTGPYDIRGWHGSGKSAS